MGKTLFGRVVDERLLWLDLSTEEKAHLTGVISKGICFTTCTTLLRASLLAEKARFQRRAFWNALKGWFLARKRAVGENRTSESIESLEGEDIS
jgi:hypothetical protein